MAEAEKAEKPKKKPKYEPTISGVSPYEAVSALQKAIRRGELDDAMYWSSDLDLSGYAWWVWQRLAIIASEDVGPAWNEGAVLVNSLYGNWRTFKSSIFLSHAVIALTRAPKSRIVDVAHSVHHKGHDELQRAVPDYAYDQHTAKGRAMGRGHEHFRDEAAQLENAVFDEEEEAYKVLQDRMHEAGMYDRPSLRRKKKADDDELPGPEL